MRKYDAIVVGGGNGGLAAAAVLAKGGKKVALFEKNHTLGGVAQSFRRGRFDFEVSLHELCGYGRGENHYGTVRQLFDYLEIEDRINWVSVPNAYRLITYGTSEKIDAVMPFGISEYIDAMEKYVPGSRKKMTELFGLTKEYLDAAASMGSAKSKTDLIKKLLKYKDFLHTCSKNVNDVLKEMEMPEKAANILRGYWAYLCADCDQLTFMHYMGMVNSYIELKSVIPASRSLEMTTVIADCIEENGGKIYIDREISSLIIKDGKACGVVTKDGEEYFCDDVICDLSPNTVFGKMVDKKYLSESDRKKTNARELAGRGFCVFLGLNKSAEELGLNDYSYFIYPDMDTVKQYKNMATPETNGSQNTVCINAADKNASPDGTCILTMTTLFTSDYWEHIATEDYHRIKDEFASKMISDFEKATGIKISEHIEEIEIATPETFCRYMGSPEGSIYGYKAAFWDGVFARKKMDKQYTDIKGLEFVGGYGANGNGYSSAFGTGYSKGKYILSRDGLRR